MADSHEIGLELGRRLKRISDDKDFVVGVLSVADHPDDRKALLEYIDSNPEVTTSDVVWKTYVMRCTRDGEPIYDPSKRREWQDIVRGNPALERIGDALTNGFNIDFEYHGFHCRVYRDDVENIRVFAVSNGIAEYGTSDIDQVLQMPIFGDKTIEEIADEIEISISPSGYGKF